jgi:hypothetical protein
MTVPVDLPDDVAQRLASEAARRGVTPEELAAAVLDAQLPDAGTGTDVEPLAWIGSVSSEELRGRDVDELLAKGFGQSPS